MTESTVQIVIELLDQITAPLGKVISNVTGNLGKVVDSAGSMATGASNAFSSVLSSAQNVASGVASAVGNITTVLGTAVAAAGVYGIQQAANFQKLRIQLDAITGSQTETTDLMDMLASKASTLPLDLPSAQKGILQLRSLGIEGQRLKDTFRAIVAEVGVFGNVQNLNERLTLAFAQTISSQNMQAQEARQFMNANIPVYKILAQAIKDGTVEAKGLTEALVKQGGTAGATAKQVANAKDQIKEANDTLAIQKQRLEEANATHPKTITSTQKYTTAVKNQTEKLTAANSHLATLKTRLDDAGKSNTTSAGSVASLREQISKTETNIRNLTTTQVEHTKRAKETIQVNTTQKSTIMALNESMDDNREKIKKYEGVINSYVGTNAVAKMSVDDLASALREGLGDAKINSIQAVDAIAKWMIEKFEPTMIASAKSFSGQVQIMKNNLQMLGSELVGVNTEGRETGGVFTVITDALKGINFIILDARKYLQEFNGEGKAGIPVWLQLGAAFLGLMSIGPFLGMVSPALGRFGTLGAVILIVAGAIGLMRQHWDLIEPYWNKIKENVEKLHPIFDKFKEKVIEFGINISDGIKDVPNKLSDFIKIIEPKIQELKNKFVFGEADTFGKLLSPSQATWGDVLEKAKGNVADWREKIEKEFDVVKEKIVNFGEAVSPIFQNVWKDFLGSWEKAKVGFKEIKENLDGIKVLILTLATIIGITFLPVIISFGLTVLFVSGVIGGLAKSFGDLVLSIGSAMKGLAGFWDMLVGVTTGNQKKIDEGWKKYQEGWTEYSKNSANAGINFIKGFTGNIMDIYNVLNKALTFSVNDASKSADKLNDVYGSFNKVGFGQLNAGQSQSFGSLLKQQHGGIIPGSPNMAVPIIAHGGERIIPSTGADLGGSGGGGITINITGNITVDNEDRIRQLAYQISKVLGRQSELARYGTGY